MPCGLAHIEGVLRSSDPILRCDSEKCSFLTFRRGVTGICFDEGVSHFYVYHPLLDAHLNVVKGFVCVVGAESNATRRPVSITSLDS